MTQVWIDELIGRENKMNFLWWIKEDIKAWRRGEVRRRNAKGKKEKAGRCYVKKDVLRCEKLMEKGDVAEAMRVGYETGVLASAELKMTILRKDGTREEIGEISDKIIMD